MEVVNPLIELVGARVFSVVVDCVVCVILVDEGDDAVVDEKVVDIWVLAALVDLSVVVDILVVADVRVVVAVGVVGRVVVDVLAVVDD